MLCQQGVRLTTGGVKKVLGTAEGDGLQELETSQRVRMRRRLEDTRVEGDLPTKSCFPPPPLLIFYQDGKGLILFFTLVGDPCGLVKSCTCPGAMGLGEHKA